MRYAAIDAGTNSCRLLVADGEDNRLKPVCRKNQITRLGEKLNSNKSLNQAAMERTVNCLREYAALIKQLKVNAYRAVTTCAVREAVNSEQFISMVRQRCGLVLEVISGDEEAHLSYQGVKTGLSFDRLPLVVDLGGGSCEFKLEKEGGQCLSLSLPLGAVRATEANMSTLRVKEILAPIAEQAELLKDHPLVMVGGTATTLVAIKFAMDIYDPKKVHGQKLRWDEVTDLYNMLKLMPLDNRRRLPGLQPDRADIIPAGAMIIMLIMEVLGHKEIVVSESDIMEGIIRQLEKTATNDENSILL